MISKDIRWHQRLYNFEKALSNLTEAIELSKERTLSKLEKQGLIQAFEYTYELAWNTIKDFYQSQGETDIQGSRDAFKLAFQRGLIENGQVFMDSIKSRQLTTHSYNEEIAQEIYDEIIFNYYDNYLLLFIRLKQEIEKN